MGEGSFICLITLLLLSNQFGSVNTFLYFDTECVQWKIILGILSSLLLSGQNVSDENLAIVITVIFFIPCPNIQGTDPNNSRTRSLASAEIITSDKSSISTVTPVAPNSLLTSATPTTPNVPSTSVHPVTTVTPYPIIPVL
ncbi:uncharacterized protein LOC134262637 [Saccostrea cucullata]|uniref:uncharacterized protein LOC134262637 n=1 Tax=Saccostrea cuccullata TaxID=36930 RepID=UPI002ED61AAA